MTLVTKFVSGSLQLLSLLTIPVASLALANDQSELVLLDSSLLTTPHAVPFDSPFYFNFDSPINCSEANATWVKVTDANSKMTVPGRVLCKDNTLIFVPTMQLSWYSHNHAKIPITKSWQGLRAGHSYHAELSTGIVSNDPTLLFQGLSFEFSMAPVDYGVVWFNASGLGERRFKNIQHPFLNPMAPTAVVIQGRQEKAVKDGMWRNNPFLKEFVNVRSENLLAAWKSRGFNMGVLFWEQFSDEYEAKAIEHKLWNTKFQNSAGIPYLNASAKRAFLKSSSNLVNILCDNYLENIRDLEPSDLRLIGHSVGAQVAVHCAWRSIPVRTTVPIPNRIVLLDSFWGKGGKSFLNNAWTGAVSTKELSEVVDTAQSAVEQYKSSPLGGVIGDANLPIRKHTAFVRLWPNFLHGWAFGGKHNFSLSWYLESIVSPVPVRNSTGALGAAATDDAINQLANKSNMQPHVFSACSGALTSTPTDDELEVIPGLSTW